MPSTFTAQRSASLAQLPGEVRSAFAAVPAPVCGIWLQLRSLILESAIATPQAGPVTETMKWGEPSYACQSGTPVRLGWKPAAPNTVKLLVHCQTHLVTDWRALYSDALHFEGNRAILLDMNRPLPREVLAHCIAMALTYKVR